MSITSNNSPKAILSEDDIKRIKQNHSEVIAKQLQQKVESINENLKWRDEPVSKALDAFGNPIREGGLHIGEAKIGDQDNYRAIFIGVNRANAFIFHSVIKKRDQSEYTSSKQKELINNLVKNKRSVQDSALQKAADQLNV